MRSKRILWFLVMIGLGAALGMVYGWIINPVEYTNATPEILREDYKTDYVLMTAEIYQADGNLEQAARRLNALGGISAASAVEDAVASARALEYIPTDISAMVRLAEALQGRSVPETEGAAP